MVFLWFLQERWVLRTVLGRGSEKGVSRRCLERPLGEYDPLGVRPNILLCWDTKLWIGSWTARCTSFFASRTQAADGCLRQVERL